MAALWHPKAKAWVAGRKNWSSNLKVVLKNKERPIIWFHCASLGEFEQGRPLMELIKKKQPQYDLLLTFFSPSGYEVRKNYAGANHVCYLPLDTRKNAATFINIVQPKMVFFVKYEFWYHYLHTLSNDNIPTYLIGAIFRPDHFFFKWSGKKYSQVLTYFSHIFVQEAGSMALLKKGDIEKVSVAGDPRIDRVFAIANTAQNFPIIKQFKSNQPLLIIGSSHPKDEAMLLSFLEKNDYWQVIIAPHETNIAAIQQLTNQLSTPYLLYSDIQPTTDFDKYNLLIINSIGILNQLYQYADVAYIGGGFDTSIHNTLEPAVFGVPILIGPNYQKFEEAKAMVQLGGMIVIKNAEQLQQVLTQLEDTPFRQQIGTINYQYLEMNRGGTEKIYKQFFFD